MSETIGMTRAEREALVNILCAALPGRDRALHGGTVEILRPVIEDIIEARQALVTAVPDPRPVVAETLRVTAFWVESESDRDTLLDASRNVNDMDPDDLCCALCEEVTCDDGCPMKPFRSCVTPPDPTPRRGGEDEEKR